MDERQDGEHSSIALIPAWAESWFATLGADATPQLLESSDLSVSVLLALRVRERFRCLQFPGSMLLPDYCELPIRSGGAAGDGLADSLDAAFRRTNADAFVLDGARPHSATVAWARGLRESDRLDSADTPVDCAYWTELASDWDTQLAAFRPQFRRDTRRRLRRLGEHGPVRLERIDDLVAARETLAFVARHHQARRESQRERSIFQLPAATDFYDLLVQRLLDDPRLHFTRLLVGSRIVAAHLGFKQDNRLFWALPVFDTAFSFYSPGRLLLFLLVQAAIDEGVTVFDLGVSEQQYKFELKPEATPIHSVVIAPRTLRGKAALTWFGRLRPQIAARTRSTRQRVLVTGLRRG
jgi:CelD/BcsL family acetyltransferase involved in cellulose biosynthesis